MFRQLPDETRLAVLMLVVAEGELCVCELVAALQRRLAQMGERPSRCG